jgi:hypothetical protein
MSVSFSSEKEMTRAFLESPQFDVSIRYVDWSMSQEFEAPGLFGVPDILIAFGKAIPSGQKIIHTYAFELKIRNWRRALAQAYRYSAFAHFSTVVLDQAYVHLALANLGLFERANIGLLSVDTERNVNWHYRSEFRSPYSVQLYRDLYARLETRLFETAEASSYNRYDIAV